MNPLHRYWIAFDLTHYADPPMSIDMGLGVTAHSEGEALAIVQVRVFSGRPLPATKSIARDLDVSALDPRHIRPNMGNPAVLGIWFPLGFQ
jgi:hypothetical protein